MKLELLEDTFAIHRFSSIRSIPEEVFKEALFGLVKTDEGLSIACRDSLDLSREQCHRSWSCIKISGPLEPDAIGILASLSKVLANARISIFVLSTYDTDYILIPAEKSPEAIAALKAADFKYI